MERNKRRIMLFRDEWFLSVMVFTLGLLLILAPVGFTGAPSSPPVLSAPRSAASAALRGAVLDQNIQPTSYRIHIQPNYADPINETTNFKGMVEINVNIASSVSAIQLHVGSGMTIDYCELRTDAGEIQVTTELNNDIYSIQTSSPVEGLHTILLNYTGMFQTQFNGFYKSTYKKSDSETGIIFTTHFQPTHARKAFPCFDEPNFKSTFSLTLDVPSGYGAMSNTPSIEPLGENRVTFETTLKMSSYLVAFVVYEVDSYISTEPKYANGVSISTWGSKDAVTSGLAEYSQEVTPLILETLENYTGIPYLVHPMTKIDQLAISDFSAGAMENWGLVIYRDTRLYFNETGDGAATRKGVATIIAHELTHQWFGNLVTTKWWDTTWLNEGFARYLQYLIISRIYHEWRMMDQLLVDQQMSVFVLDSVDSALPLTSDVTTPEEIRERFGTITYSKGASFLRMISKAVGEENFQEALQLYLQSHAYDWVIPEHLYSALDSKTPNDRKPSGGLEKALDTWATQAGFPVVNVERNYTERTITLTQTRFFPDGPQENSPEIYNIPVVWSSKVNSTQLVTWFTTRQEIPDNDDLENWILVHAGYYRVNYDEMNWFTLMLTMRLGNRSMIAPEDRTQLFEDALALSAAGYMPYNVTIYMLRCLPDETDVLPWAAISRHLDKLDLLLGNVNSEAFYGYIRSATAAVYEELKGFSNNGSFVQLIHRPTILRWACRSGNMDCLENAYTLLDNHLQQRTELDKSLKGVIFCYGIMKGESKLWHQVWEIYKNSEDSNEKTESITALGCTQDPSLINLLLASSMVLSGEDTSPDTRSIFSATLSHPKGIAATLDFILENISHMRHQLPNNTYKNILRDIANHLSSEIQYKEFLKVLQNELEQGHMMGEMLDELADIPQKNLAWVRTFGEDALEAFTKATRPGAVTTPNIIETTTGEAVITLINRKLLVLLILFPFMR